MRRFNWGLIKPVLWLIGILTFLLLIVLPLTASLVTKNAAEPSFALSEYLVRIEALQRWSVRFLVGLWVFVLGSCFASFLNVVAWRVPKGRTILGPSRCPYCHVKLSFRDNFPVIGWLRNGGRCSTCRLPISSRYLIVEIILGLVFLLLALTTLGLGGATLPIRSIDSLVGFDQLILNPRTDLLQVVSLHLVLILLLFTFVLVELENAKIPLSILGFGVLVGVALPLLMPAMQLMVWDWPFASRWPMSQLSHHQFLTLGIGVVAGILSGVGLNQVFQVTTESPDNRDETIPEQFSTETKNNGQPANFENELPNQRSEVESSVKTSSSKDEANTDIPTLVSNPQDSYSSFLYGMLLIGLILGWQSTLVIAVLAIAIGFLAKPWRSAKYPFVASHSILFVATLIHLFSWRWMNWLATGS